MSSTNCSVDFTPNNREITTLRCITPSAKEISPFWSKRNVTILTGIALAAALVATAVAIAAFPPNGILAAGILATYLSTPATIAIVASIAPLMLGAGAAYLYISESRKTKSLLENIFVFLVPNKIELFEITQEGEKASRVLEENEIWSKIKEVKEKEIVPSNDIIIQVQDDILRGWAFFLNGKKIQTSAGIKRELESILGKNREQEIKNILEYSHQGFLNEAFKSAHTVLDCDHSDTALPDKLSGPHIVRINTEDTENVKITVSPIIYRRNDKFYVECVQFSIKKNGVFSKKLNFITDRLPSFASNSGYKKNTSPGFSSASLLEVCMPFLSSSDKKASDLLDEQRILEKELFRGEKNETPDFKDSGVSLSEQYINQIERDLMGGYTYVLDGESFSVSGNTENNRKPSAKSIASDLKIKLEEKFPGSPIPIWILTNIGQRFFSSLQDSRAQNHDWNQGTLVNVSKPTCFYINTDNSEIEITTSPIIWMTKSLSSERVMPETGRVDLMRYTIKKENNISLERVKFDIQFTDLDDETIGELSKSGT